MSTFPFHLTRTDETEAALVALLKAALVTHGVTDIAALTTEDMDEDDNILVQPPAVRIVFANEALAAAEDFVYTNYTSVQEYIALVGASRPSTVDIERAAAQGVLELVKNVLAGARLVLASNSDGAIVGLRSATLFHMQPEGTWYAIRFVVESFTQFDANIGVKQ